MFPTPVRILVFAPSRSGRNDCHRNPSAVGKDLRGEDLETCSGKGVCFGFSAHCLGFARLCRTCGACEAGHVILRGTWTEAEPALDFREAHQAFIKRSFSKGSFREVAPVSKIQDPRSTILPGRPSKTRKHSGCWILDVRKSCLFGVRARWTLVPGCWI